MNVPSTNQHSGQLSGFHYCFYCSSLITWQGRQGISAAQLWNSSFCSLPYHAVYLPAFLPYAPCCSIWFNWAPAKYTDVYILCISFIKVSLLEPTVSSAFNLLKSIQIATQALNQTSISHPVLHVNGDTATFSRYSLILINPLPVSLLCLLYFSSSVALFLSSSSSFTAPVWQR